MTDFVLDNSVTMRWCFDAGTHEYADNILRTLMAAESSAFVPILWRYEVSAVLARAQLRGTVPPEEVAFFLEDLANLDITVDTASGEHVLTDVHRLAITYRLTSYDAAYLELTLRKKLPLATLDDDLRKACLNAGGAVI